MFCRRQRLCNAHVNPNVQRGLLHVTEHVKSTQNGERITKKNLKGLELRNKRKFTEESVIISEEIKSKANEHEFCLRCGRKLRNHDNRILGYGPVCYAKVQQEKVYKKLF